MTSAAPLACDAVVVGASANQVRMRMSIVALPGEVGGGVAIHAARVSENLGDLEEGVGARVGRRRGPAGWLARANPAQRNKDPDGQDHTDRSRCPKGRRIM